MSVIGKMKAKGGVILNMASIASTVGIYRSICLLNVQRRRIDDDLFRCQRLPESWYSLQQHFSSKDSHAFCRWFHKQELPWQRKGNVRKFIENTTNRPNGRHQKKWPIWPCTSVQTKSSFITGTDFPIDGGFIKLNG